MNFIRLLFIFCSSFVVLIGLLVDFLEPYVPTFVSRMYRYGKFSISSNTSLLKNLEVPKRYFKHFYIFAAPLMATELLLTLHIYFYGGRVPEVIYQSLDFLIGDSRKPFVSAENTFLCAFLLTIQTWKRLYETTRVNVFSDKFMNISIYVVGFAHYFGAAVCIVGESEGFVRGSSAAFRWNRITLSQIVLAVTFLWATYKQFRAAMILADLRKNRSGDVISSAYKIPHGELFEYVSAPLQLTEIILYTTLSVVLWEYSITFHYVTVWVIVNQVECALLTHWWYQENFKNYPKTRKALIPYIL